MDEKRRNVLHDAHRLSPEDPDSLETFGTPQEQGLEVVEKDAQGARKGSDSAVSWYGDFDLAWSNFDSRGGGSTRPEASPASPALAGSQGGPSESDAPQEKKAFAFLDLEPQSETPVGDNGAGPGPPAARAFIDLDFPEADRDEQLEGAIANYFERPLLETFAPSYATDDFFVGSLTEDTEAAAGDMEEAVETSAEVELPAWEDLNRTISDFSVALNTLREQLEGWPELSAQVFEGADEWIKLLEYKLLPHVAGAGCLVISVAGGTNTGKSTVFNRLLREDVSPVRVTAAATRRPVLAGNAARCGQCLDLELLAEFLPRPLENVEELVSDTTPPQTLFVRRTDTLPNHLVLLDIPDVDSIDTAHWEVAENIQAAGDVLIAVLTPEKYKDERVVTFFRRAHAAGRMILPLMNKASPDNNYEVARIQLEDFCNDVELGTPACFVVPYDVSKARDFSANIVALSGEDALREYLELLDATAIKEQVYRVTVNRFASQAAIFLEHTEALVRGLRPVIAEFENRAKLYAHRYDPAPGAEVGGLFHEFVQSKRNRFDRAIGNASRTLVQGVSMLSRTVSKALFRRTALETSDLPPDEKEVRQLHVQAVERFARELATSYYESARSLQKPSGDLILGCLEELDLEEVVAKVVQQTLQAKDISEEFRTHAEGLLEDWWRDHAGKRRVIEALDRILLFAPAGIAGIMAVHTAGVGLPEAMVVAGPIFEQFAARVLEYQFGDAMFDFVSPWCEEQQAAFENALHKHLTEPCLQSLRAVLEPLGGELTAQLRRCQRQCLTAS